MTGLELQQYLLREYPQENARCEWKGFKHNNYESHMIGEYISILDNI